jgi:rubrerythrin
MSRMTRPNAEGSTELAAVLQLAFSGELAAGYAYRGHWKSVRNPQERERIRTIEEEEWHHRELVGAMLRELGVVPKRWRELRAAAIGRSLGLACHLSGYLAPMYGAGRLESRNVREYEAAARLAHRCGRHEWIDCLLTMAEVEWEHERYFRQRVVGHRWGRRLELWPPPPPKEHIRQSFGRETGWKRPRDTRAAALAR